MKAYKVIYHYANGKSLFYMNAYSKNEKTAIKNVRKHIQKTIKIIQVKDITTQKILRRDLGKLCTLAMRFTREILLLFVGVDIALRYHLDGLSKTKELLAIAIAGFGIYGFLTYGINLFEKYCEKLEKEKPLS